MIKASLNCYKCQEKDPKVIQNFKIRDNPGDINYLTNQRFYTFPQNGAQGYFEGGLRMYSTNAKTKTLEKNFHNTVYKERMEYPTFIPRKKDEKARKEEILNKTQEKKQNKDWRGR